MTQEEATGTLDFGLELHEGRISYQLDVVERVRPDDGSES